jgi:hypothetical protein
MVSQRVSTQKEWRQTGSRLPDCFTALKERPGPAVLVPSERANQLSPRAGVSSSDLHGYEQAAHAELRLTLTRRLWQGATTET